MNYDSLPFTEKHKNGTFKLWNPQPSGDYDADTRKGAEFFKQLHTHIASNDDHLAVSYVLQSMVSGGSVSGVEVGFCHALSVSLTEKLAA